MHYYLLGVSLVSIMRIQTFCEHLIVLFILDQPAMHLFEVRLKLYATNARLVVGPPSLSPTPRRHGEADGQVPRPFPPFAKFQLVWRRLCEVVLLSSSLAGQTHPSLLSRLCLECRRYESRCPEHY